MFEAISVLDDCFERRIVLSKTNRWASDLTYFFIWTFLSRKKGKLSRRGKIQHCVDECKAYIIYYFWFNSLPLFECFLDCFVLVWPLIGANLSFSSIVSWLLISLNVSDLTGQKVGQNSNQPQKFFFFFQLAFPQIRCLISGKSFMQMIYWSERQKERDVDSSIPPGL